jgi:aryl-alcohol dehydrogenase-like predicted oxidoreductase
MTVGCWAFGGGAYWGEQSQKDVDEVVHTALDLGINCFDTAEMYNGGESERSLGMALRGRRDKAVVISKISPSNCRNVRKHCEESLKRLGTDFIDVYLVHWPIHPHSVKHFTKDEDIINNPPSHRDAFTQLDQLKNEGLIRSAGMSNFGIRQMAAVADTGVPVDVNELPYNILSRAIEDKIAPCCMERHIGIIGSMGLQQGLLAGIYRTVDEVPCHQAHSRHFANDRGQGTSRHGEAGAEAEVFRALDELRALASEHDMHIARLAIAWILSKSFMTSALVGSRNIDELRTNIAACSTILPEETLAKIDEISLPVWRKLGSSPDYYENAGNSRIF